MRLKGRNLLVCVVVEDSQLEVVRARDKPVLPWNKSCTSYRHLRDLERLHNDPCVNIVDVDRAVVETGEYPGFRGVEVDILDTV